MAVAAFLTPAQAGGTSVNAYILTITERDQDNVSHPVANEAGISDVNSTLTISLNNDVLQQKLAAQHLVKLPEGTVTRVQRLNGLLAQREAAMVAFRTALEGWNARTADPANKSFQAFQDQLTKASKPAADVLTLAMQSPEMAAEIGEGLGGDEAENYRVAFAAATHEVERLQQVIADHSVYVQFGANIATAKETRPVHLEGFDTYAPGATYQVTRWVSLQLTPEEQQTLAQYSQQAAELNRSNDAFLAYLKAQGANTIVTAIANSNSLQQARALEEKTKSAAASISASAAPLRDLVAKTETSLGKFIDDLTAMQTKYKKSSSVYGLAPDALLIETNNDLAAVVDKMKALTTDLQGYAQQFRDAATRASGADAKLLSDLAGDYDRAWQAARDEASGWLGTLRNQVAAALYGRTFDASAYTLGQQVTKLLPGQIPDSTQLPLLTTGYREPGDAVLMTVQAGDATTATPVVLERQQVSLYQVIPHTQRLVGMIFARDRGRFRAAPCYSLMVKGLFDEGLRRKSVLYDQFYDPGTRDDGRQVIYQNGLSRLIRGPAQAHLVTGAVVIAYVVIEQGIAKHIAQRVQHTVPMVVALHRQHRSPVVPGERVQQMGEPLRRHAGMKLRHLFSGLAVQHDATGGVAVGESFTHVGADDIAVVPLRLAPDQQRRRRQRQLSAMIIRQRLRANKGGPTRDRYRHLLQRLQIEHHAA
jgi:hypothetical protein